ncbi:type II toxin-antitoxin system RelB/DinJ family antitoxin [Patescibacteria group bacterium]|nr:type II toxin-antitoxin system RelB/DinJ family antitoxin [Patescibacteria group bacterium]
MSTAVINIKTDIKIKKQAQKVSADLGLSLSGAINAFLRQMIRDKKVYFSLDESNPSEDLLKALEESRLDRKKKRHYSFKNNREALDFLRKGV